MAKKNNTFIVIVLIVLALIAVKFLFALQATEWCIQPHPWESATLVLDGVTQRYSYQCAVVTPGHHSLTITAPGYQTVTDSITISDGQVITKDYYLSAGTTCVSNWQCTYGTCNHNPNSPNNPLDGIQFGTCTDLNSCSSAQTQTKGCVVGLVDTCTENWQCTSWSACNGGTKTRTCQDLGYCNTFVKKPSESVTCSVPSSSPTPTQNCNTAADTDCNGHVDRNELGIAISGWTTGTTDRNTLGQEIQAWING